MIDKLEKNGNQKLITNYQCIMGENDNLMVSRPVYRLEDLHKQTNYEIPNTTLRQRTKRCYDAFRVTKCVRRTIPLIKWLPNYRWRQDIFGDIISGITVAIMHIPQGMAYGLLGNVPPVVGIYMAFFPVLAYFFFGTSRHISIGTFAIVCMMTGKIVGEYSTVEILQNGTTLAPNDTSIPAYTNVQVATTVTFTVATVQIFMYICRLGILSTLLSETLVNGFTCAAAFHVVSSQLKDLLGVPVKKRFGFFSFFYSLYDAAKFLPQANLTACGISLISCTILGIYSEIVKPRLAKKTRVPVPIELLAVVIGTMVAYYGRLKEDFNVNTVGHIPTGFPTPTIPLFHLIPSILVDSIIIAIVAYSISMSMGLIFARKLFYEIDPNQELLALGVSNTLGSFFSCMPVAASLSRSMIQQAVGGVTQIASIISCLLLSMVLLWIGPFFQHLPKCVLASIIVVALKSMVFQIFTLKRYWQLSKWDAAVWLVTFGTTVCIDISTGLAAGILFSLFSVFMQGFQPRTCILGLVPNTDLYLDVARYKLAQEIVGIKIFHYGGGLSFASRDAFKQHLKKRCGFEPAGVLRKRAARSGGVAADDAETLASISDVDAMLTHCVILDFASLTFVDPTGVDFLRQLQIDYEKLNIQMLIAGCSSPVYETFLKCNQYEQIDSKFNLFPTIHDAVLYAKKYILSSRQDGKIK